MALAAVMVLAGCGGDDGGGSSSPAADATAQQTQQTQQAQQTQMPLSSGATASSATGTAAPGSGSTGPSAPASNDPGGSRQLDADGCIADYDPSVDYYADKQQIEFAKFLQIDYHSSYQVVTVTPPGGTAEKYVLLWCGAPEPDLTGQLADAPVITTPVSSLYSASTTHLPALVELDQLDVLTGVGAAAFVSEQPVLDHIAAGGVADFAPTGAIDAEAVIAGHPDVLVGGGFADPAEPKIAEAGIPVVTDVDAAETHPLGQAEWIKLFAALTGTEGTATTVFDTIVTDYQATAKLVADAEPVQIVPGQPYQGTWYVPGGKSWKTRMLLDAGGTSAWAASTSTGSITTDFEKVFASSKSAPVWLASTTWTTEKQALAEDPRFAKFTAFAEHNVWNPVKGVTESGGNPYYELGAGRPDLVLADLVAILHPDVLPDHEFTFYVKLSG